MPVYSIEALGSAGGTLLTLGIFFYTNHRFGWGLSQNFMLATGQGLIYVVGALLAGKITARFPHHAALAVIQAALAATALLAGLAGERAALVVAALLAYTFVSAMAWPIIESLASSGVDARSLSRRLAIYNIVWPGVGWLVYAVNGLVLETWPAGMFVCPAVAHALAGVISWRAIEGGRGSVRAGAELRAKHESAADRGSPGGSPSLRSSECCVLSAEAESTTPPAMPPTQHSAPSTHPSDFASALAVSPEPELLRSRKLALWLSRLALPATYAVIYGLMPMVPFLPAVKRLGTSEQTLVTSAWLAARLLAFIALGLTAWWHTRPRLLVAAAVLMLVSFLGITLPPSLLWPGATPANDLAALLAWQLLLGVALGMIYSASLYFGMVLSDGSTEHGGYHEALIGVGYIVGPAAGVIAQQWAGPDDVTPGVIGIGGVILLSVLAVAVAAMRLGRNPVHGSPEGAKAS